MKKLAFLSHCVLNSFCELPAASSVFRKQIMEILLEKDISIVQLPCPELCYQALERESILAGSRQAADYSKYCQMLLSPIVQNLKEYSGHGIQVAGMIGIDPSPSCSVIDTDAIMMKYLLEEMKRLDIPHGKLLDMPTAGDGKLFFTELNKW